MAARRRVAFMDEQQLNARTSLNGIDADAQIHNIAGCDVNAVKEQV